MKPTSLATVCKHLAFVIFMFNSDSHGRLWPTTEHPGGTINSETWLAETTHYVTGDILVNDNEVLTIMPGAVIKFAPGTLMTIRGTLRAVGTANRRHRFYLAGMTILTGIPLEIPTASPSTGDWTGIYLYGSGSYNGIGEFDYCRIRYGGGAGGTSANVYYNHVQFRPFRQQHQ